MGCVPLRHSRRVRNPRARNSRSAVDEPLHLDSPELFRAHYWMGFSLCVPNKKPRAVFAIPFRLGILPFCLLQTCGMLENHQGFFHIEEGNPLHSSRSSLLGHHELFRGGVMYMAFGPCMVHTFTEPTFVECDDEHHHNEQLVIMLETIQYLTDPRGGGSFRPKKNQSITFFFTKTSRCTQMFVFAPQKTSHPRPSGP